MCPCARTDQSNFWSLISRTDSITQPLRPLAAHREREREEKESEPRVHHVGVGNVTSELFYPTEICHLKHFFTY